MANLICKGLDRNRFRLWWLFSVAVAYLCRPSVYIVICIIYLMHIRIRYDHLIKLCLKYRQCTRFGLRTLLCRPLLTVFSEESTVWGTHYKNIPSFFSSFSRYERKCLEIRLIHLISAITWLQNQLEGFDQMDIFSGNPICTK